jgi:CRP-like cAMP-binding protein
VASIRFVFVFQTKLMFGSYSCNLFVGPGDYVAREGEAVDGLYIILDGQVKL